MNHEITKKIPLLDGRGHLTEKGYATKMNFLYNRENVKSFPLKLKEWNFYQFLIDHYSLQFTIGHVSYMCSVTATLIDLKSGRKHEIGSMKPLHIPKLDLDPEANSLVEYRNSGFYMSFEVTGTKRILYCRGSNKTYRDVEIRIEADNEIDNEKMVIATPFAKPTQFYLNYKENYYHAAGFARFDDFRADFDGAAGLLDWGRGVWPYSHEWFWGSLSSHIDGVPFGFNIGWGFGDLSNATENMYFYDRKAYKLGTLTVKRDPDDYMKPWFLHEEEGKFQLSFVPMYNNYTENKYVVVNTHCNQVYGYCSGSIETAGGRKEFGSVLAFIEHAVNKW